MDMQDIYKEWRSYENENILLRPVKAEDAKMLLQVYSDKEARKLFNCDNFEEPCYFDTMEEMQNEIQFYLDAYKNGWFIRWSIEEKRTKEVVGTIELCKRAASDDFDGMGILRMDIRSDYERAEYMTLLIELILQFGYDDLDVDCIATKALGEAKERTAALEQTGFKKTEDTLVGNKGEVYKGYWTRRK